MPDNHIHPVPETAEAAVPSDISTSPIQSGLDVQVMPLKANLQAADPDIERTGDLQTASSDLEISGDLQATGPVLNNLQVAASVHQGSDAGGLQISASVSISLLPLISLLPQVMIADDTADM
jgi:hypothetical protein